jgi:hypothetical protein
LFPASERFNLARFVIPSEPSHRLSPFVIPSEVRSRAFLGEASEESAIPAPFSRKPFAPNLNRTWLVYFQSFQNVSDAIARETEIKGWRREKKVALVHAANPTWEDLAEAWAGR